MEQLYQLREVGGTTVPAKVIGSTVVPAGAVGNGTV